MFDFRGPSSRGRLERGQAATSRIAGLRVQAVSGRPKAKSGPLRRCSCLDALQGFITGSIPPTHARGNYQSLASVDSQTVKECRDERALRVSSRGLQLHHLTSPSVSWLRHKWGYDVFTSSKLYTLHYPSKLDSLSDANPKVEHSVPQHKTPEQTEESGEYT
ncbi:hypothetical protein PoB_000901900 [Plakobranchus ocellatus]|uniref:Uncharacterized protein n=1 Tax=Plakobranchus ocellatus TaxID=259542 RepID=A0AAV3YHN4_9GAST|nr:hypothetical protein PoB_000901900 [Plakobranchus ocellatus]